VSIARALVRRLGEDKRKREDIMSNQAVAIHAELADRPTTRRIGRHLLTAARIAMGLVFFVFGLNGFLNFIPPPSGPVPAGAMAFGGALMQTGYMFPLIKGTETLVGFLLLSNLFVPLALVLIAPVLVNIVAFHAFLAPDDIALPLVLVVIEIALAWSYRKAYRPLLARR
jgi:uncharacterized membrane protein YphA (DoxX/SURF4 family)